MAVGRKAAAEAWRVESAVRADLAAAAVLHDIGYGHVVTGCHPLDGARFLAAEGFSRTVCKLVAHHSASTVEAEERGIHLATYDEFATDRDLGQAHAVLWWADMTTGPTGQDVTVEDRLAEICERYAQATSSPVSSFERGRDCSRPVNHPRGRCRSLAEREPIPGAAADCDPWATAARLRPDPTRHAWSPR